MENIELIWWTIMLLISCIVYWFVWYTRINFYRKIQQKGVKILFVIVLLLLSINWILAHALDTFMIVMSSWQAIILVPTIMFMLSINESDLYK